MILNKSVIFFWQKQCLYEEELSFPNIIYNKILTLIPYSVCLKYLFWYSIWLVWHFFHFLSAWSFFFISDLYEAFLLGGGFFQFLIAWRLSPISLLQKKIYLIYLFAQRFFSCHICMVEYCWNFFHLYLNMDICKRILFRENPT